MLMASRREQKEQARAARLAAAEAERVVAVRRRRLGMLGGIVLTAAVVVAVFVALSSRGGGTSGLVSGARGAKAYRQVERLLTGIPQSGMRLGSPRAPVTMTYVGDLECPYCRAFTLGVLPQFIAAYVRPGRVKIVYRSLCTATCHFNSSRFVPQQVAAYAAGRQGLFWQYAELFYREQEDESQPYVTDRYLRGLAQQIPNLGFKKWLADRGDRSLVSRVHADQAFVTRTRLPEQTPELLMSGPHRAEALPANALPTSAWLSAAVQAVS